MAKTPTERVREYRLRHPDKAKKYYAASRAKKKAKKLAEIERKRAVMAKIMEQVKK